ncbi:hypothetical protein Tco_1433420, partial [Tanacetum coccineum]
APPSPDYHVGDDSSKSDPSEAFDPLPTQEIPFGRLYHFHLNGARMLLTVRKTVRPEPTLLLGYGAAIARWNAAPLSTLYLIVSSELSSSPTTSLQAVVSAPAVLSHVPADHLPPRKRFRGSPALSY